MKRVRVALVLMLGCGGGPPTATTPEKHAAPSPAAVPTTKRPAPAPPQLEPADPSLAGDFAPPLRARGIAGEVAGALAMVTEPPTDPAALETYRVVGENGDQFRFFADLGGADYSLARVLQQAPADRFALVVRHDVVVRPTPNAPAAADAPGIELRAGDVITAGETVDGWTAVDYAGPGTRGHGYVEAGEVGRTYPAPPRRHPRGLVPSKTFVAPGTQILAAPKGAALAEVTIVERFRRPGVRYPVTVLRKKRGYALIALVDPWSFAKPREGPVALVRGWVKLRELLPDKPLPVIDAGGEPLHGAMESLKPGESAVRLAIGTRLLSLDGTRQLGVIDSDRPVSVRMHTSGGHRIVALRTNAGTIELRLGDDAAAAPL